MKTIKKEPDLVEVFDVEQGTDEWHAVKCGVLSASHFGDMMAAGDGKVRSRLMRLIAGERLSRVPMETFVSKSMDRGKLMEPKARSHYAFTRDVEVAQVGFVKRTIRDPLMGDLVIGASPDGLIGEDGALEIKTMQPDLIVDLIDKGRFPTEHLPQCHGVLWATGRRWCDLKIYFEGMPVSPTFHIRRDEKYIVMLEAEARKFEHELSKLIARVEAYGSGR